MVEADSAQIHQLLLNLMVNACQAMPSGGRLCLRASERDEGLFLEVTDTGTGFKPSLSERIFEPFFTSREFGQATGLGLATVDGIVRQHAGTVSASNRKEGGASFQVWLPRYEPANAEHSSSEVLALSDKPSIMVVDDEPALRRMLVKFLARQGYGVVEATDGEDAFKVWQEAKKKPELLLSDVRMPGLDGPGLARKLQAHGFFPKLVFVSGFADARLEHEGFGSGEYEFLPKPFTLKAVKEKLEELGV